MNDEKDEQREMDERLKPVLDKLALIAAAKELNEAEYEHLEEEGPLMTRLHRAIVRVCELAGVQNRWESFYSEVGEG